MGCSDRLMNTRGLETLVYLENLDLSENLIELYVPILRERSI